MARRHREFLGPINRQNIRNHGFSVSVVAGNLITSQRVALPAVKHWVD
jgi:hypothetical protein